MRKGTVLRIHGFGIFDFISKNGSLMIILLVILSGIVFGVFAGEKFQVVSWYTHNHLQRFLLLRNGHTFFHILLDSYMASLFNMLLLFAGGTSMLGAILVPVTAIAEGIALGAFPALLYLEYSIKGIAFHAVLVLPAAFLFLIVYLLAVRESFQFSLMLARLSFAGSSECDLSGQFRNYCGRYLVLSAAALLPAFLDALLSYFLIGRFGL